jgi:hypothetical protein
VTTGGTAERGVRRVAGRVVGPSALAGFLVTARGSGRELDRAETDPDGKFQLAWRDAADLVHIAAFARWGACLGETALDADEARGELIFQAPEADILPPAPELEEVGASPTPLLPVRSLEQFYNAVSRAEQSGAFDNRFGPLEVTGWIHLFESSLEELETLSARLLRGDPSVRARLLELLEGAPRLEPAKRAEHPHDEAAARSAFARANRPVDIVAAALLIDPADTPARAAGVYVTRIDGVNKALTAAE